MTVSTLCFIVLPCSPTPSSACCSKGSSGGCRMRACMVTVYVWCIEYSVRDMFRWWIFVVHTAGWRQIQEHLPLSSALRAELTDGVLTLWSEQGGKRYDKTSCQGQAQGSWLKCDENIKVVTLSYKANTGGSIFSVEQVQEHAAAISVCCMPVI